MKERVNTGIKATYFCLFIIVLILFNPILPIYLYDRSIWLLIDIIASVALFVKPMLINNIDKEKNSIPF
ncbi:DUF6804 family protein [Bacillus sp. MRMR6]|uniref:DUF6804 family protein n=1 Tax=Bacillus sp. MRMR6 TaxID=1928617 RepID=UPI0034C5D7B3